MHLVVHIVITFIRKISAIVIRFSAVVITFGATFSISFSSALSFCSVFT